jgi:putative hydrolase of the HAD superfamily
MIRTIFFDAIGTLILPQPAVAETYAAVGRKYGSRLGVEEIAARFRRTFQREEEEDRRAGWRTDEAREERRWRTIVGNVLDDVTDLGACFAELWHHFAQPRAWRCVEGAEVLAALAGRGYRLGLASNYDSRLRSVLAGLPELKPLTLLAISSEVGWRKPAPEFFARLAQLAETNPGEILFIGDDPVNDVEGPRTAGLQVLPFDPYGGGSCLRRMGDLRELLVETPS